MARRASKGVPEIQVLRDHQERKGLPVNKVYRVVRGHEGHRGQLVNKDLLVYVGR